MSSPSSAVNDKLIESWVHSATRCCCGEVFQMFHKIESISGTIVPKGFNHSNFPF